jgi:hypothetical protein
VQITLFFNRCAADRGAVFRGGWAPLFQKEMRKKKVQIILFFFNRCAADRGAVFGGGEGGQDDAGVCDG